MLRVNGDCRTLIGGARHPAHRRKPRYRALRSRRPTPDVHPPAAVDWAADRLTHSSDPIAAIAYEAGSSDQSHLTRAFTFKRHTGRTPGRYRRSLR